MIEKDDFKARLTQLREAVKKQHDLLSEASENDQILDWNNWGSWNNWGNWSDWNNWSNWNKFSNWTNFDNFLT